MSNVFPPNEPRDRMDIEDRESQIAVVGMSCRLPGARDTAQFWARLCAGEECIRRFGDDELRAAGVPDRTLRDPAYVRAYGALDDAYAFDAPFFGVSAREALAMDPQQRVFLECAWSALEDAAIDPARFGGVIGVYAGSGGGRHLPRVLADTELVSAIGAEVAHFANARDFLTTRVSYKLGLRGPSLAVQTACSTSLVAIHLACQSLLNRECDAALAGGVTIVPDQVEGYPYQEGGILSPDGHCRAFDARAAGTVAGSGAGVVVLRRMVDALRDGDPIHAVILGSAINNDGDGKIGFTAPSVRGQAKVITEALAIADVDPSTISYVEAHGTGTPLGDPIEIEALAAAFGAVDQPGRCALGAVKTNIGHVDTAAGVAGFIKTVLALEHRMLPPTLHFERANPETGLDGSPFAVNTVLREWPEPEGARRAGVSSFGMGGTNAHVVLEEAPAPPPSLQDPGVQLLVVSARTEAALERARRRLAAHLADHPGVGVAELAHTLQEGRAAHAHRWAAPAADAAEARAALEAPARRTPPAPERAPSVAFLFPGQGTQYAGMARELYAAEPVFRDELDRCAAAMPGEAEMDLRDVLFPAPGGMEAANALLLQTQWTQPALFAVQYALARLWISWGVRPEALLGHSIGEYAAACVAGVFSPEAAMRLVAARGRLMQDLPGGAMLAVPMPEDALRPLMPAGVSLAAVNGPANCVVSGEVEPVEAMEDLLAANGVAARRLHTSHAFHSAAMEPILDAFSREVRAAAPTAPSTPFLSNVTGDWITAGEAADVDYWVRHLRQTVRFADGMERLLADPRHVLVEVGPGDALATFARRRDGGAGRVVVGSLPRPGRTEPSDRFIRESAGTLWTAGVALDWAALRRHRPCRRVPLPTYPFDRTEHRVPAPRPSVESVASVVPVLSARSEPMPHPVLSPSVPTPAPSAAGRVAALFAGLLGVEPGALDPARSFLEQGADSLLLMQASRTMERDFGVKVPFRRLLEGLDTLDALAAHLAAESPALAAPASPSAAPVFLAGAVPAAQEIPAVAAPAAAPAEARVRELFAGLLGVEPAGIDADRSFLEQGADSLLLMQASRTMERDFGVKVPFRKLLEGLETVSALAAHLSAEVPALAARPEPAPVPAPAAPAEAYGVAGSGPAAAAGLAGSAGAPLAFTVPGAGSAVAGTGHEDGMQQIVAQQLATLQTHAAIMQAQLELLRAAVSAPPAAAVPGAAPRAGETRAPEMRAPERVRAADTAAPASAGPPPPPAAPAATAAHGPHRPVSATLRQGGGYTPQQAHHFDALVERYTQRTRGSREYTAGNRAVLADNRASLNFRMATKELMYPVVGERSQGSRMWDVDGNEYVDFTIGFGVHFFGHRPAFIVDAVDEQLRRGFHLGPQSDLAGPAARMLAELTGMERVAFCNTGSEAVMTALRIARTVTGRDRVVLFDGSYHGCFDGILARPTAPGAQPGARPVAPGTPQGMVDDVVVLPYGTPETLEWIRANAGTLAAVLVEPVQSRQPEFHPREFLRELRAVTEQAGTALVFDEMITGLRLQATGAQGMYGVQADLATYGKVIGGGFPLGVVAGSARMMDAIDGGTWNYGDDSYPTADQTFFAGTFCKHPVVMAAACAVLRHLRERGPALYEELNARAARLVAAMRRVIDEEQAPIRILSCASLFQFRFTTEAPFIDLLFYHMLERGVYIWEGRACFLSTAHTDEDCDRLVHALRDSIHALQEGGFLAPPPGGRPGGGAGAGEHLPDASAAVETGLLPAGAAPAAEHEVAARPCDGCGSCAAGGVCASAGEAASIALPGGVKLYPHPAGAPVHSFALTPAQRQIWVHAQLGDDASRAYNEQLVVGVRGALDAGALRSAVADVIGHHEALRTVFAAEGDVQHVLASIPVPLAVHVDAASTAGDDASGVGMDAALREVFDLRTGPLFRVHVHPAGAGRHVVQLVMHHLVADALGGAVLMRDLDAAWAARREGRTPCLPGAMQFREYAALLAGDAPGGGGEAAWLDRFRGAAPLALPLDRPRPRVSTHRAGVERWTVERGVATAVRDAGRREGCTLFATLLGGLAATLHRVSGSDDLVVGIPSAGRPFPGSEGVVGHCVDVLPVRTRVAGRQALRPFLRGVRGALLDAQENEAFTYARLLEALQVPRGPGHPPLVSVTFNVEPPRAAGGAGDGAAPRFAGMETQAADAAGTAFAKFDLHLDVLEADGALELICTYNTDLFDRGSVRRLLAHLQRVLHQVAVAPERPVAELELMDDDERRRVVDEWNRTSREVPAECVHRRFEAHAAHAPDAPALVHQGVAVSYAALNARANRIARVLRRRGVGADARVAVYLERGPELAAAVLGVIKAGGAYVPLDPAYPSERLAYMLSDAGAAVLLTSDRLRSELDAPEGTEVVTLEAAADEIDAAASDDLRDGPHLDHLAYLIYTSGSTGRPKGVMVPHRGLANVAAAHARDLGVGPGDRVLLFASPSFDASVFELAMALSTGATAVSGTRETLAPGPDLLRLLADGGVTLATLPPSALAVLPPAQLPALRTLMTAGEALPAELVERWAPGRRMLNLYGPTEATIWSTTAVCAPGGGRPPIGRPVANTRAYVLDAGGAPVPVGVAGELYVGGHGVVRGYAGRPGLTAERFVPDPFAAEGGARLYRTGDRARWLDGGELEFLGRMDAQVKVRGFRIEPGEVEAAARRHPGVADCVVVAHRDEAGETRLAAYVVGEADADALRQSLRRALPEYMVPASILVLPSLPLTANGKVDRRALPAPRLEAGGEYVAPRTPVEEVLAGVWAEVLGVERVGAADDFFALGGHSLLATRIVSRVRGTLGADLTLRALFEAPTVAALAARVEALRAVGAPALPPVVPAGRARPLPLSFEQERLWFLDRLEPGSAFYNLPVALRLHGALDAAALARALADVVARHEALRTTFHERDGVPVQVVGPADDFALAVVDLSTLPAAGREDAVRSRAAGEAVRPFDLAAGPLFRATLLRVADDDHVLLLCAHHIVSDGWSLGVLFRELAALYPAHRDGRPSPLPELPVQYGDYAVWQREQLEGRVLERQLAYWTAQLAGAPQLLELPADHPRPAEQSFRGGHEPVRLPAALLSRLESLARREGATPYMVVLAAFQALLGRYAGTDDVVVGSPIAGRTRAETEDLIGFFVNTLVLRTDLGGDPSFRALLGRVREVTLGAYAHQEIPFEKLVEALQPERSLSHAPLFQVMFTLANTEGARGELPGLRASDVDLGSETVNFDLTLYLEPDGGGLAGSLVYSTDLFDAATIRRAAGHLVRLLEGVADDAGRRLSRLELMGPDERARVLHAWQPPAHGLAPACVHDLVSAHAARDPQAPALVSAERTVSFGALERGSNRLARRLRALGVGHGTAVGVLADHTIDAVSPLLAVLKAGGVYLPLHPDTPPERMAYALADAGAPLVLAEPVLAGRLPDGGPPVVALDASWSEAGEEEDDAPLSPLAVPASPAYLIYTSGSTGLPKAVVVSHGAAAAHLREVAHAYGHTPADRGLVFAALAFDQSVEDVLAPLVAGGSIAFRDSQLWTPAQLAERVEALGITAMNLPTPYWNHLVSDARAVGALKARMRAVIIGNEPLQPATVRAWDAVPGGHVAIVNGYGPTETVVTSTLLVLPEDRDPTWSASVPIGRTLRGRRGYVLDASGEPVPVGVPGELCVGGAELADGYLGRPALTAEKFVPDAFGGVPGGRLYRTGDRVRWRADGQVEFLSRIDQQVKIRGFRVELGEIEAVLRGHGGVHECCVAARDDAPGERRLVAYVVGTAPADELRALLRRGLPDYMVPAAFVFLDALPLTRNGKVDRRVLPAPPRASGEEAGGLPRTPAEEVLAGVWAQVLRRERVGVHENFFEAGGHSLLAMRVVARVRELFGVELPVRTLFEDPTVASLAERVEDLRGAGAAVHAPVVAADRSAPLPLSFAQERLWFLDRMEGGSPFYNMRESLRLRGALDTGALERALGEIVRRHEALRTTFSDRDGQAVQVINSFAGFSLPVEDLASLAAGDREAVVQRLATAEAGWVFDLSAGPLFRARLLRLSADEHVLLLCVHHIVSDGWSMDLFFGELSVLYEAFRQGLPSPLPDLSLQFADYAVWQREQLAGDTLRRELAYWTAELEGAPALLELPTDFARPATRSYRGASERVELPAALADRLQEVGRAEGATLYMVVLAAFQILLGRWAGTDDVVVGSPVAGRSRREVEGMFGFFVNTLVLRTRLDGDPDFREVLRRVRRATLGAYDHQEMPFEKLVAELQPERSLSHAPIFQAGFTLDTLDEAPGELTGLQVQPVEAESTTARFDLMMGLTSHAGGITGHLEYGAALFERATMVRLLEHLRHVLEQVAADPGVPVHRIRLAGPAERERVLQAWSGGTAAFPAAGTLHARFAARVADRPGAVAVSCGERSLTYAELDARSSRLAHRLRALGVGPESRVGLCAGRSVELVAGILGILKAGGAYVPLDPAHPAERLAYVAADSGIHVALADSALRDRLPPGVEGVALDDPLDGESDAVLPDAADPRNLAYVIYTSGSTGRPKGVGVTHANVLRLFDATDPVFGFGGEDVWTLFHSYAFDFSVWELWGALLYGGRLVVVPWEVSRDPAAFRALLAAENVTVLNQTPSAFRPLALADEAEGGRLEALRVVVFGGEALQAESLRGWLDRYGPRRPRLVNMYGITETTVHVTWHVVTGAELRRTSLGSPVGVPIADLRTYVLDPAGEPAPVGVPGELYVGGAGPARGYLGRPALTAQRFVPDPFGGEPGARLYRSGDRARWRADGTLEYLGRIDQQVKIRGFRIEPGEIRAALLAHPAVAEAAVVVRGEGGEAALAAYVVPAAAAPDPEALRAHLLATLPEYMVPTAFVALERLPLTSNGKLDARALPAPEAAGTGGRVAPRTPVEQVLAGIWERVLKVREVGLSDHFFELGGHSLLTMRLITEARAAFAVELPIRIVFGMPTLEAMAAEIERRIYEDVAAMPEDEAQAMSVRDAVGGD